MSYFVMRLYSGAGDRSHDETLTAVQSELFPKLKEAGGLIRYTTLAMDGGGIASTSVYENRAAAQRGVQVHAGAGEQRGTRRRGRDPPGPPPGGGQGTGQPGGAERRRDWGRVNAVPGPARARRRGVIQVYRHARSLPRTAA